MRYAVRILLPLIMLAAVACSKHPPETARPDLAPVHVAVDNGYALPVEVSVSSGGSLHRLGVVHPGMQGDFVIPPAFVEGRSVEFSVTPQARGPLYRSGPMLIAAGEVIDLKVAQVLFNSSTTIRP